VRVNSKVIRVEKQGNSIAAKIESIGRISEIAGTHMLVATGRRPNTDDLGLDKAGIATDARGYIQVDDQLRTNSSGIWAMGDCNGRGGPLARASWPSTPMRSRPISRPMRPSRWRDSWRFPGTGCR
jgi:pyruvate/2-oxoglutarate dehydrogenase complex dihydrolipoamide dehydrogenase (E3) component